MNEFAPGERKVTVARSSVTGAALSPHASLMHSDEQVDEPCGCDFSQHTNNLNSIRRQLKNPTFILISSVKIISNLYVKQQQASLSRNFQKYWRRKKLYERFYLPSRVCPLVKYAVCPLGRFTGNPPTQEL